MAKRHSRPTVLTHMKVRFQRAVPLVVWLMGCGAVVWMFDQQHAGLTTTGYARAVQYSVASELPGRVSTLLVGLHDQVEQGQVLASLDSSQLELELQSAQGELKRLSAEFQRQTQLENVSAEGQVENRINRLRRFARDREQARVDLLSLEAEQEESRMLLVGLSVDLGRQRALAERMVASEEDLNDIETRHNAMTARIEKNTPVLDALRAQLETAVQRYDTYRDAVALDDPQITMLVEPFRWAVEVQRVALEKISLARSKLSLVAPASGTVANITIRSGEVVAIGQPVLTILESEAREIVATVSERMHLRVQPGMRAVVQRLADRSTSESSVLRKGPRIERMDARVTGDTDSLLYGVQVFLQCPADLAATPGEAFEITLLDR